jgi:hypothetical protein
MSRKASKRAKEEPPPQEEREPFSLLPWLDALGNVLIHPREAFEWLDRTQDWRLPVTMMAAAVVLATMQSMVPMVVPIREGVFLGEQITTIGQSVQNIVLSGLMMGAMFQGLGWLLKAGAFWVLLWGLTGSRVAFKRLFLGIGLAWLPHYLRYVGLAFAFHARSEPLLRFFSQSVPLPAATNPALSLLLAQLDIFTVLSIILCVQAAATYVRLDSRKQVLLGVIHWLLAGMVQAALQVLIGAAGGAPAGA